MPSSRRFLVIVFTSAVLGTMATFGFARLKTLITNRINIVSLTWNFVAWRHISSDIAAPITKGFVGKTRGSANRGSCWNSDPTGMEGHPSHSSGLSLFNSISSRLMQRPSSDMPASSRCLACSTRVAESCSMVFWHHTTTTVLAWKATWLVHGPRVGVPYSKVAERQSRPRTDATEGTTVVDTERLFAKYTFTSRWPVASFWRSWRLRQIPRPKFPMRNIWGCHTCPVRPRCKYYCPALSRHGSWCRVYDVQSWNHEMAIISPWRRSRLSQLPSVCTLDWSLPSDIILEWGWASQRAPSRTASLFSWGISVWLWFVYTSRTPCGLLKCVHPWVMAKTLLLSIGP